MQSIFSKNTGMFFVVVMCIVLEMLPIIRYYPNHLLFGGRVIVVMLFFTICLKKHFYDFNKYFSIFILIFIVESLVYCNHFIKFFTFESYIIRAMIDFVYMMMGNYFYKYSTKKDKEHILDIVIIIIVTTSITTLMGIIDNPLAVRALGNGGFGLENSEKFYYGKNIASWGMVYAFSFILPCIVVRIKKERSIILVLSLIVIELMILSSQIMFAILLSLLIIGFSFFCLTSYKKILTMFCIAAACLTIIYNFRDDIFFFAMDILAYVGNEQSAQRLGLVYTLLDSGEATGDADARFDLYMTSFITFLDNPLLGFDDSNEAGLRNIGGHSQIFDLLASVGLFLGGIWIGCLLYLCIKISNCINNNEIKFIFLLNVLCFLGLMLVNPTVLNPEMYLAVSLLPSLIDDKSVCLRTDIKNNKE